MLVSIDFRQTVTKKDVPMNKAVVSLFGEWKRCVVLFYYAYTHVPIHLNAFCHYYDIIEPLFLI